MRLNYPTCVKIVKLPCTGRIDVLTMLKAFESGADGIYIAGCLEGECHFLKGNLRAKKRLHYLKKLLAEVGLEPERAEMFNLSSAQGQRFAAIATDMTEQIRTLGPSPIKKGQKAFKA
jgi:F420-non-reducing hydrogenase iron-sulfur subunit